MDKAPFVGFCLFVCVLWHGLEVVELELFSHTCLAPSLMCGHDRTLSHAFLGACMFRSLPCLSPELVVLPCLSLVVCCSFLMHQEGMSHRHFLFDSHFCNFSLATVLAVPLQTFHSLPHLVLSLYPLCILSFTVTLSFLGKKKPHLTSV